VYLLICIILGREPGISARRRVRR